ncbi:MAG: carboxypeptidase-like regulatory domain-containing protein [Chitinophagaceae bacterium]|nr:carboxypeptidase-like regulatory domain-containing protein [Chitinophagaceae bacterium]
MPKYFFFIFLFFANTSSAQKIYGTVFSDKGDLLPYASITIKGTSVGASANNKAKFSFPVMPGTYTVVCQHIGYKMQEKNITVLKDDAEIVFVMAQQQLDMTEVVIQSGAEDPAYAIIRQAIKKRNFYFEQVKGFECELYTKDLMKLRSLPKKILGRAIPEEDIKEMGLDSSRKGIIYLSESIAKIYIQQPDKFKMEVISSRVSGSDGFGFTFPTFISLYQNNVSVFLDRLNPRGFVSPIADAAISMYKFKYLGSFYEDGKEINSIQVIPRRSYEPVFSGTINITDGDWRIHSCDLLLTKTAQLEIVDTLKITQIHVPVGNDVWRVKNQLIHFSFKQFGIDAIGNFVSVYSGYTINPEFAKNRFNNIIINYDTAVNKKPVAYWDSARPVPLEPEEKMDYRVKDSIFQVNKDSALSQTSVDSLNKKQGKLKVYDVIWKGIHRTKYTVKGNHNWGVESLIKALEYNTVEGLVINVLPYYSRYSKKLKTNFSFEPGIRYGFSNGHLNAWADLYFRTRDWETDKKLKRQTWTISGGKRVSQFNKANPITALTNSVNTLLWGDNFMKIYENYFGSINFNKRYENGLRFNVNVLYEDRIPLDNTSDFTIFKKNAANFKPNFPFERIDQQFTAHQAFVLSVDVSIKPGQRYIQFPNRKMSVGSKYPTFSFNYTKGFVNIFGSDVNFDKWRLSISDDKNFKLAGLLKYKIGIGGFINDKKVFIQDFHHFTSNRSTRASEYVNSFQLAHYYIYSTTDPFYGFAHLEHHFNGLLTNKIPLFKRLNWNLVAGGNALYTRRDNNYTELFVGLENLFKIFRVDYVFAFASNKQQRSGVRIGTGGILGGSLRTGNNRSRRSTSVSL